MQEKKLRQVQFGCICRRQRMFTVCLLVLRECLMGRQARVAEVSLSLSVHAASRTAGSIVSLKEHVQTYILLCMRAYGTHNIIWPTTRTHCEPDHIIISH
jgi:hypothetical protein